MASDGSIRIEIEVDGKQVSLAAKELEKLEEASLRMGKGLKSAENSMDSLGDKSAKVGSNVKGAGDAIERLGDSGSKAGNALKSADGAIDALANASTSASRTVADTASSLGDLGTVSSSASKNLLDTNLAIGDIAGGSTAASGTIKSTTDTLADLGSISSTAGSNLQNTNLVLGDIAGGSTVASANIASTSDSLNNMGDSADNAANANKRAAQETENVGNKSGKASIGIKELAVSLGLVAVASKALAVLKSSVDAAISRFDTLNTFPAVLQALGVSAEESQRAMAKLSDGIDGLPTKLNDIAANAQRMYTSFNDMDEAADTAIALNNAMLGSGASAADAQRGTEQYLQVLQKGKFEMEEWKTLQETMDVGLVKIAESLGFVGKTAKSDLYDALKYGAVSVEEFNEKLIELGTGTGVMAQLAKENSLGLATSIGNLQNAAARGVANIIDSFNKLTKEVTGKDIAQNIDSLKVIVNSSFKVIGSVIEGAAPTVKVFASAVQGSIPVVKALSPAIIGLMTAYGAYVVITKASSAIEASNRVLAIAQASQKALTLATSAQIAAQASSTTATAADTVAKAAQTGTISLSTLAIGVMTGTISASTAAQVIATTASYAFGAAIKFLLGPVGWITAGIGLLVTGVIALVKWFNKSTEEGERLAKQTDELASSTESLNTSVDDSARAYEKNQSKIETNAEAYAELAAKAEELAAKEKLTGEEKKTLNSYIEELNRNVSGLNLVYGEQSNALSATSEQIVNRINLMKEEEKLQAAQERLTEIMKEQIEIGKQQDEITTLREEWNLKLEEGSVKSKEHKKALEELETQEVSLSEANKLAGEERLNIEQQIIESSAAVAAATEEDTGRQLLMFDELSKGQQEAVESMKSTWDDYASAATDMFDKLSDKSKLSVADMQKNLEENQRVITTWSENIAKLAERGIDEGLLNTLREAGPESAGHVNALVKASDTELQKLSEAFSKGGDVATEALSKSLGIEKSDVLESVGHLVIDTEKALAESIKNADFSGLGEDIAKGQAEGITKGTPVAEKAATEMAKATEDAARKQLQTHSPSKVFEGIGEDLPAGLVIGINNGTKAVLESAKTLAENAVKPFKNTPADFVTIGEEAMAGMNRGLKAGEKQVMATVQSIANNAASTMRKALDIHSPSREFEEIGKDTMRGNVVGIESQKEANRQAILGVAKVLSAAARENAKEVARIAEEAEKKRTEIQVEYAKKRAELDRKTAASSQAALKTHKNKKGQIVTTGEKKVYQIRQDAAAKLVKLNEDEQKKLAKINDKAWSDMVKKENELSKERLAALKTYVADKKSLDELSLVAETEVWRKSIAVFKEGTKERVDVQKQYQSAVEAVNKEIISINEDYQSQMQKINDDLAKNEKQLNDEYHKVYSARVDLIRNSVALFDEFVANMDKSGQDLLNNLRSQVVGIQEWRKTLESLWGRIDDQALMEELEALGPKAAGELKALNSLSDSQLAEYVQLYNQKFSEAREQAAKELEGTKKDTDTKILELRQIAEAQLSKLQMEWMLKIKNLTATTASELSTLRQIGVDAGQGLLDGLASMEGPLLDKATQIAEGIKSAIQSALEIHSPSRWMRDFIVGNMKKGFDVGADKYKSGFLKTAQRLGDYIKPVPITSLAGARAMQNVSNNTSNRYDIDKSRTMHAQVTVQSQEDKAAYERMMRRLAFEFDM